MSSSSRSLDLSVRAPARGERLYPGRSSRNYWLLTCLRREIETVVAKFLSDRHGLSLLDYGCGNMPYRPLFEPYLDRYVGCDFAENALANQHIQAGGTLPVDNEHSDIVLSSQVLEHVTDPLLYLSECYRVLKSGGLLVLSTHGQYQYHPDPTDYWRWTCDGLQRIISQSGFAITHFTGILGPEATALKLLQDAVVRRIPRRMRRAFHFYMQWRIRRADERCPDQTRDKDACVYLIVAHKQ